jgi:hypothetical protein
MLNSLEKLSVFLECAHDLFDLGSTVYVVLTLQSITKKSHITQQGDVK